MSLRGTTSSANRIVDIASAPFSGRTAVRYCLFRITTVPMPALALLHRRQQEVVGPWPRSPSGTSQYVRSK